MHKVRLLIIFFICLVTVAALVVACGGKTVTPNTVKVEMGEFYFKPNIIEVKEGQLVSIEFVNKGKVAHEFMVGREVEIHEGSPEGYEHDFFEGMNTNEITFTGHEAEFEQKVGHGIEVMVEAGGRATLTFTVPAGTKGEWEFACFIPGHYQAGQRGTFIVK